MSVLLLAVPIALLLAGSAVAAFFWAARDGQFDDLDTPPLRMLLDDEAAPELPGRRDDLFSSCPARSARRGTANAILAREGPRPGD